MPRVNGVVSFQGTYEDMTFYKKEGKNYVRKKSGVSKERIANDPNYVRTRENMNEFKQSATSGKLLRLALGSLVFKAKDNKLSSRLLQTMSRIKNLDATSARGQRTVALGLATVAGKVDLTRFDFNANAPLNSVLFAPYELDVPSGKVTITDFIGVEQLQYPEGATHVSFQAAVLAIDFDSSFSEVAYSNTENIAISLTPITFVLTPTAVPGGGAVTMFLLSVAFFQEVNGVQYSLKNEEYSVLNILEIV
jgi:hypothetical protein